MAANGARREFRARVEAVVGRLRPGEVVSYGDVAAEAGYPGAARAVGGVLARPKPGRTLPWWRVVTACGRLVPGHEREHARLLEAEGIDVRSLRIAAPAQSRPATRSGPAARSRPRPGGSRPGDSLLGDSRLGDSRLGGWGNKRS